MNASDLFRHMPAEIALDVIDHTYETQKDVYRNLLGRVARARRMHPTILQRVPRAERHPWILDLLGAPVEIELAYQCLSHWLMSKHAPMLSAYLDSFGIPHDGHGCAEEFPTPPPSAADIRRAVDTLLERFPRAEVSIYLHAFNGMPDTRWEALDQLLKDDPRLQFAASPV